MNDDTVVVEETNHKARRLAHAYNCPSNHAYNIPKPVIFEPLSQYS